jgi:hypothetical protein
MAVEGQKLDVPLAGALKECFSPNILAGISAENHEQKPALVRHLRFYWNSEARSAGPRHQSGVCLSGACLI